jgi:hypothetical protein
LDPSMTLGCGGWGGNITSDNISPKHLINIKRLAYETNPAVVRKAPAGTASTAASSNVSAEVEAFVRRALPRPPAPPPVSPGISADVLARKIDEFLGSRGYKGPATSASAPAPFAPSAPSAPAPFAPSAPSAPAPFAPSAPLAPAPSAPLAPLAPLAPTAKSPEPQAPTDFVCEEDVRLAVRQARKIVIGERTIVTPAARDLGEQHRVFVQAAWPR